MVAEIGLSTRRETAAHGSPDPIAHALRMPHVWRRKAALQSAQHTVVLPGKLTAVRRDFAFGRVILPALPQALVHCLDQATEERQTCAARDASTAYEEHFTSLLRRDKGIGKIRAIWG